MRSVRFETTLPISPEQLFELHARPEALRRLSPSFPPVRRIVQSGDFEAGTTVRIEIGVGPLVAEWVARLEDVVPGQRFVDTQLSGPFRSWRHVHSFLPAPGGCRMRDEVTWELRFPALQLGDGLIASLLRRYFRSRHEELRRWVNEENENKARDEEGRTREAS